MDRFQKSTFEMMPQFFRELDTRTEGYMRKFLDSFDQEIAAWNSELDYLAGLRDVDKIELANISRLSANLGLAIPSFFPQQNWRKWVSQLVSFWKRKGDHKAIIDAVRTVTGRTISISAPWSAGGWAIGKSEVGLTTIIGGPTQYIPYGPELWSIGVGKVGKTTAIWPAQYDRKWPWVFYVEIPFLPTDQELLCIRFLTTLLKRAEEVPIYQTPTPGQFWILNESELNIDTTLAPSGWQIGISKVGSSTIIGGPTTPAPDPVVVDPALFDSYPAETSVPTEPSFALSSISVLPEPTEPSEQVIMSPCTAGTSTISPTSDGGLVVTTPEWILL